MTERWNRWAITRLLGIAILTSATLAPAVASAEGVSSECPVPDGWAPVLYASTSSPYFDSVFDGVDAFAREFGIDAVTLVGAEWAEWAEDGSDRRLEDLIADGIRAFAIHPDEATTPGLLERLAAAGANVVMFGTSTPPTATAPVVAIDARAAAMQGAEALIEAMGGSGNIVLVLDPDQGRDATDREEGIRDVVARSPDVTIIQGVSLTGGAKEAVRDVAAAVAANIEVIDGLIAAGPRGSAAIAEVLADYEAQGGERDVHAVGFGADPVVLQAAADGVMAATVVENRHGQGYLSLRTLTCLVNGFGPVEGHERIDPGSILVTAANSATYASDLEALTDEVADELLAVNLSR